MNLPPPIRVFGLGSPHGDDAAGWEVIRQLRQEYGERIEAQCVDGGQRLLDQLEGHGTLIIIDATRGGQAAGKIQRFNWPDSRVEQLRPATSHDLGLAAALELAEVLGTLPPRVVLYGIEAAGVAPAAGLSPAVAAAVPKLVRLLLAELGSEVEG